VISVVIAAHRTAFLSEAIASVLDQTVQDFEILVAPSGGVRIDGALPDRRIRVAAREEARGETIVELGPDDVLATDALERFAAALRDADFAYSNFAMWRTPPGEPAVAPGFRSRDGVFRGRPVKETLAWPPSAAALARASTSPRFARAWKRAGGDIVSAYLAGRLARVDHCLYLRRVVGDERVEGGYAVPDIEALVAGGCRPAIDLAAPGRQPPGWTAMERADLRERWPWADGSVGAFRGIDVLQRLPDKGHAMSEIHRCLAPGGWLVSATPSALGAGQYIDPSNRSGWVRQSFLPWTDAAWGVRRFATMRLEEGFPTDWHRAQNIPYVFFDAVALKPGYDGPDS